MQGLDDMKKLYLKNGHGGSNQMYQYHHSIGRKMNLPVDQSKITQTLKTDVDLVLMGKAKN
jgi:predicted ATPase